MPEPGGRRPVNHILLADDDAGLRNLIATTLSLDGHQVSEAGDGHEAMELLRKHGFQLVITDLNMPGPDGLEIVSYIRDNQPGTPVIIISGYGSVDNAVEAMRLGAFDFQEKPLNTEHLRLTIQRALRKASLGHALDYMRHEQPLIYRLNDIVAHSPGMQKVLDKVARVADTDVTVLLTGETGTGKSLISGAIHANSYRRDNPLITVNCAALAETLLESELFGHEKGAFTGAHKNRVGRFQQAHGGTLFLDEVGDMSAATQAKALRAIEEKVVRPLGGSRAVKVDVRIIAATNVDLAEAVQTGRFREDLFYRIAVTPIHIPPLRERPEDILPLAQRFMNILCGEAKRPRRELGDSARQALVEHTWPGNIRELRNVVERAILFAKRDRITADDLGLTSQAADKPAAPPAEAPRRLNLRDLEAWAVNTALAQAGGVQKDAAELLGISPRALSYKLKQMRQGQPD